MDGFIDHFYYINLEFRIDRKASILESVIEPLQITKDKLTRISGVDRTKERLKALRASGCSHSHLNTWKLAIENNQKFIMVFEDDFTLDMKPEVVRQEIVNLFQRDPDFNICCLGYNPSLARLDKVPGTNFTCTGSNLQTTSCYIVNIEFIKRLIPIIEAATRNLENNMDIGQNAIDIAWKQLQNDPNEPWYVLENCGNQKAGYSDIEKRPVRYKETFPSITK